MAGIGASGLLQQCTNKHRPNHGIVWVASTIGDEFDGVLFQRLQQHLWDSRSHQPVRPRKESDVMQPDPAIKGIETTGQSRPESSQEQVGAESFRDWFNSQGGVTGWVFAQMRKEWEAGQQNAIPPSKADNDKAWNVAISQTKEGCISTVSIWVGRLPSPTKTAGKARNEL